MDWKRCKYRKGSHLCREMRMRAGRGHFSPARSKARAQERRGGSLVAGRWGHRGLHTWDCSAFWGHADLFLTSAWAVSSYGFYSSHWREAMISVHCLFAVSPSMPLPGRQPQHCSSLGHVISHAGQVKYFP